MGSRCPAAGARRRAPCTGYSAACGTTPGSARWIVLATSFTTTLAFVPLGPTPSFTAFFLN